MRIALAGNPNSGKTTMYNALTGKNEKVGNWAGVTVDKKEGNIKRSYFSFDEELIAVDLPGAYSMSPFTSEESVTSSYVRNENPDIIINIVDATNLSRSLFFTTQLLELGIPVVVALNKSDINEKRKTDIDIKMLSSALCCPVVETISTSAEGLSELIKTAISLKGTKQKAPYTQGDINLSDKKTVALADRKRFEFVNKIVKSVERKMVRSNRRSIHDKIDKVLTNRWLGIPIFAFVMFLVFDISQSTLGPLIADIFTQWLGMFKTIAEGWMAGVTNDFLKALVLEGIIEGVIAVVGFLPLVMVMYFLIALLEDCGYMARVSVVLDPIFKRVGLSGKSVIPFVIGTGCAVPGVMACRTIRNERERRATALLAPFMPCGAKLPVIALFVGAFFPEQGWIGTLMYFAGIVIIFLCALLINQITAYKVKKSFFIMEIPEYKVPSVWRAVKSMCGRGWAYIVKAGTVILVCNFIIYLMQNFNWSLQMVKDPNLSILASIGKPVAYALVPVIGVAVWQMAASAVTGFIAKECVVGTLATCMAFGHLMDAEEGLSVAGEASEIADIMGGYGVTAVAALAFLVFNIFSPPCFAAIGAMNSELKSKKWLLGGIALQLGVGFTVGFLVYQIGTLVATGSVGNGFLGGLIAVAVMAAVVVYLIVRANKRLKAESASKKASGSLTV